jgi:hypothetical protein
MMTRHFCFRANSVELLAHNGVKVMQAVAVGLETGIATVGTDEYVGVHKDKK